MTVRDPKEILNTVTKIFDQCGVIDFKSGDNIPKGSTAKTEIDDKL